ncbi:MAG: hypothetical protein V4669_11255 [Pseudomonadota bacterium]
MGDWAEQVAAAQARAEHKQAAEQIAEGRFDAVHDAATARGDVAHALQSDEMRSWMAARHETDAAWGEWATMMDARPDSEPGTEQHA